MATLTGGEPAPTGTLTFDLIAPNNSSVSGCDITLNAIGDGMYTATCFLTLISGSYTWDVTYSGDANNNGIGPLQETVAASTVVTPEPSSYVLMLLGVGLMFVMRKRIGLGLPQAS